MPLNITVPEFYEKKKIKRKLNPLHSSCHWVPWFLALLPCPSPEIEKKNILQFFVLQISRKLYPSTYGGCSN